MEAKGLAFPFQIDPETGGVRWSKGKDKIRQNIRLILGTRQGERPMLRDFGTRVASLVHDPNDAVLADLVQNQVQQAIIRWEPRVLVTGAHVEQEGGELRLRLLYVFTNGSAAEQIALPLT